MESEVVIHTRAIHSALCGARKPVIDADGKAVQGMMRRGSCEKFGPELFFAFCRRYNFSTDWQNKLEFAR